MAHRVGVGVGTGIGADARLSEALDGKSDRD